MIFDLPPQNTQPAPAPAPQTMIMVHRAKDQAPLVMLGFVAFGLEADLAKLDAAAKAAQLQNSRVPNANGQLETMTLFVPGTPRPGAMQLFHDAMAGKYGKLRVEAIVVNAKDAADGIDLDKETYIVPSDMIAD